MNGATMSSGGYNAWNHLIGPVRAEERCDALGDRLDEPYMSWLDAAVAESANHSTFRLEMVIDNGDHVRGLYAVPHKQPKGLVLALHQTTEPTRIGVDEPFGLSGDPELYYAAELAARGYLVVGVNYPGFGDYDCDPYALGYQSVIGKGLWNHYNLTLLARERFGHLPMAVVGHSLGGTNALFLAAWWKSPMVVICSAAFTMLQDFAAIHDGTLGRWSRREKYIPCIESLYDNDPKRVPCDFDDLMRDVWPNPLFASVTSGDAIFPIGGARVLIEHTSDYYLRRGDFEYVESNAPHAFPTQARQRAYSFIDEHIGALPREVK